VLHRELIPISGLLLFFYQQLLAWTRAKARKNLLAF
jgi:hypothetical protein